MFERNYWLLASHGAGHTGYASLECFSFTFRGFEVASWRSYLHQLGAAIEKEPVACTLDGTGDYESR